MHPPFLFINYYFPPVKVVGAIRLFHLSQELTDSGHPVIVVTCKNRRLFRQDESMHPNVQEIVTVPAWDWRTLRLQLSKNGSTVVNQRTKETSWSQWLIRAQDSFPLSLLLGDGGLVYIIRAYWRACRLIRKNSIHYLFSSYRPYADHWVGYLLKLRFPHLFWIADFRDLHVDPTRRNVLWPHLQNRIDQWLLRKATIVTTVSQGLADKLPAEPNRIHILRNAIPKNLLERRAKNTKKFTITYTGAIYPALQKANLLLQALSDLLSKQHLAPDHLQLIYLGKDGSVWDGWMQQYRLSSYSFNCGELSRESALAQQSASSINLLLSWSSPELTGILTSKIYEYLSSGVPTLTIINGSRDIELEKLIETTGGGRVFYSQPEQSRAIKQYLLECYDEWKKKGVADHEVNPQKLQEYTWPEQVKKFRNRLALRTIMV